MLVDN